MLEPCPDRSWICEDALLSYDAVWECTCHMGCSVACAYTCSGMGEDSDCVSCLEYLLEVECDEQFYQCASE